MSKAITASEDVSSDSINSKLIIVDLMYVQFLYRENWLNYDGYDNLTII